MEQMLCVGLCVAEPILLIVAWVRISAANRQQGWRRLVEKSALAALVGVTAAIPLVLGPLQSGWLNGHADMVTVVFLEQFRFMY